MNSIWNKNLSLFIKRFPALAKMFSLESEKDIPEEIPEHLVAPIEILQSKSGVPTAKDGGKWLHSAYNPLREAETAAKSAKESVTDCEGAVFFSCGLGYAPLSYAKLYPKDTIILVENDPRYFFTSLSLVDWSDLFSHQNFIIALGTGIDSVVALIEQTSGLKHTAICENQSQSAHSSDYFSALRSLIARNKRKVDINASTLEKFSKLWLRNTCKNLHYLKDLDGINIFKDSCPKDLPVVILAAGPTLEEVLPDLAEIKKKAILIAVDTALRACLRSGVEPDFIVLTDPQYWAWRHIAGLSSPSSILITESAAYPAVFRFKCKKIIMASSMFPLGQYIEKQIGSKGELVAGGSVSTTAWDFARFIGAKEIYFAGLDLGYPDFQTHICGSTFEEAIHKNSTRFNTAEKMGVASLFGANPQYDTDYAGNKILTDSKMKMFAWWFESKAEEFKGQIKTYSLSARSLKIPGFDVKDCRVLRLRSVTDTDNDIGGESDTESYARNDIGAGGRNDTSIKCHFDRSVSGMEKSKCQKIDFSTPFASLTALEMTNKFDSSLKNLKTGLEELYATSKKGFRLADDGIKSQNPGKNLPELAQIDSKILHSQYKEIASLVFPTEKRLSELFKNLPPLANEIKSSLQKSKVIYAELMKGIEMYQKYLRSFF